jgi:hypothetical protein
LLVGAEQSGTTLLRLMLDSHPEIAFAEEFDYAVEPIGDDGSYPTAEEFAKRLTLDRSFATSGFTVDLDLGYADLVNGFLESRRSKKQAVIVGATIHRDFTKALHLWPDAKLVHLVRDPRDVAPARIAEGLAGNPWHAVEPWIEAQDEWAEIEALVPPERRLTVHFDELLRDHDSTLTTVCQFLGVDYTAQMLDYIRDTDYTEPSPALAGDWRDGLSARDVRLIEARVGDRLTRSGFAPSGLAPAWVSSPRLAWLRWHDRLRRVMSRMQVFGIRLTTAELATRFLGLEPLHRSIRLRFNEVEKDVRKKSWSNAKYRTSR